MIPLTLDALAAALGARPVAGAVTDASRRTVVAHVMTDSRVPAPGPAVFFALRTDRADGHAHVAAAGAAGAVAAVVEHDDGGPAGGRTPARLVVEDTWAALGRLGRHVVTEVGCRVVAITGSYGKTTVKDLTSAALSAGRRVTSSRGSFNNELGVPLTMLGVERGVDVLVAEAGARSAGDLAHLGRLLRPDVAVVTAVGPVHLETFGDEDGVAAEKSQLVTALHAAGTAVLNADDARVAAMAGRAPSAVLVSAAGAQADVRARDIHTDGEGRVRALADTPWGTVELALPMPGLHHVTNALLALAVAGTEGVDVADAATALAGATLSPSRAALHRVGGVTVLDDTYNASPPTVLGALRTLSTLPCTGRRWAVLGGMAELGPTSHAQHVVVGDACRGTVDELVVVGDAVGLAEGAGSGPGAPRVHRAHDHAAAAALILDAVAPGDAVLLKASRVVALDRAATRILDALRERAAATPGAGSDVEVVTA